MVFPTFFNLSLNLGIWSSWSEPQSAPSLFFFFFLTIWSFSIFGCKEYNHYDFGVDHLVMSVFRVFSYITICEIDEQCKSDTWRRALKTYALSQSKGKVWGWRWEGFSGYWDTCTPTADSCHHFAKSPQYCKVISLQLQLINYFLKDTEEVPKF